MTDPRITQVLALLADAMTAAHSAGCNFVLGDKEQRDSADRRSNETRAALETAIRELAGGGEVAAWMNEITENLVTDAEKNACKCDICMDNMRGYTKPLYFRPAPAQKVPKGLVADLKLAELTARAHGSSHAEATIRKAIPILEKLPQESQPYE